MSYRIILSEEARTDEIKSYHYYELQCAGLGEDFLSALEECYIALKEHPHYFSFIDSQKTFRDVKLK